MNGTALSNTAKDEIRAAWQTYSTARTRLVSANGDYDGTRYEYEGAMLSHSQRGDRFTPDLMDAIDEDHGNAHHAAATALSAASREYDAAVAAVTAIYAEHFGDAGTEAVQAFTTATRPDPMGLGRNPAKISAAQQALDDLAGERLN